MSIQAIKEYQLEVGKIINFGGTRKETAIRNAFYNLLNEYAKQKGFMLVPEVTVRGTKGKNVTPDGTLKDSLRQDWGYWESKDEADKIDDEIEKKFAKGYPKDNILFEDSQTIVLYQNGYEVMRVDVSEAQKLDRLINTFINFERPEVQHFREAIEHFKEDIPRVTSVIRELIDKQEKTNKNYVKARDKFLELCKQSINPDIVKEDIREMMIQHILTEDIFNVIFDETQFHRENNIAREIEKVLNTFFTGSDRRAMLERIQHYYKTINTSASNIPDHHEKQKFLKILYETFYKSYNPKAADRLGVIYTPNEIVKFMVESTDFLLHKHFGRFLEDKNVEILDPAAGTGTFICDIIDYIRKDKLEYKYKNEIHANEVAILPYYIANLNIEFTYKQKMNIYEEFQNLCFVDTLENLGFEFKGKQYSLFGMSAENIARIKRQNERKISVIIGNPPYNANQKNENENNKNREYPVIDKRIKDTYIENSMAQKTKMYDMYARFYRWAMDRIGNYGIIALITNRSFIDSRTFDGFRKIVEEDFDFAYIIDTKSDVRVNPKIAGTTHNVFGIQTGVAVMFLIKHDVEKSENSSCSIYYSVMDDFWTKEKKLQWFSENFISKVNFEHINPDKNNNWINIADNDFGELMPLANKETKLGKAENAIFKIVSLGIATNRDEWVYDHDEKNLTIKTRYFCNFYEKETNRWKNSDKKMPINDFVDRTIKWTSELENHMKKSTILKFDDKHIRYSIYRPFNKLWLYYDRVIVHRLYYQDTFFPVDQLDNNIALCFSGLASNKPFQVLSTNHVGGLDFLEKTQYVSLFYYNEPDKRTDNITDWGLEQFRKHYVSNKIIKEDIFDYVYAVLHNPAYRKKYELNLKREFPRIPFYDDFFKWRDWGKKLMDLHIGYESLNPYNLKRIDFQEDLNDNGKKDLFGKKNEPSLKAKLKADKETGIIVLDDATTLKGIPKEAWEYKLGNRSALEWILDQYKEKKPSDPTIAEKFNTYRFADYKEQVIDLLQRVCTVSVETMRIIKEMEKENV